MLHEIILYAIALLSIAAGMWSILFINRLNETFRLNYLNTFLYYQILLFVFGVQFSCCCETVALSMFCHCCFIVILTLMFFQNAIVLFSFFCYFITPPFFNNYSHTFFFLNQMFSIEHNFIFD